MPQIGSDQEEDSLLIAHGSVVELPLPRTYGTLDSSGSVSSTTLYEDQQSAKKNVIEEAIVEITEITTSSKFLSGISDAKFWLIFGCICWNELMANFDATLMASSHPVITSEFHSSNSASWLSTAFLTTSTAFMPMFAPLSNTFGRRPITLFASAALVSGIALCGVAPNIGSFIAARALCGLGAGGTASMGAVIINDFVRVENRANYQSMLTASFGLGQAAGVAMGGFLCDTIGWRWAFGIQVPGILICGTISFLVTPKNLGPQLAKHSKGAIRALFKTFDFAGTVLLILSITSLILYLNLGGNELPWSHPALTATLIVFLVSTYVFVKVETKAVHPVLPLRLIRSKPRANIIFSNFFTFFVMSALIFNIPLYFGVVEHDSPTVAGFRLIIPLLALTGSGFLSCMIISRRSTIRPIIMISATVSLVGTICLSFLHKGVPSWISLLLLVPVSVGHGFFSPATVIFLLRTTPLKEYAVATSSLLLWRRLGSVMGVSVSTLAVQNLLKRYLIQNISGPHQAEIIEKIRKSVHSVQELSPRHQEEAVAAYSTTLRITFASTILFALIHLALIIPIKLPDKDIVHEEELDE